MEAVTKAQKELNADLKPLEAEVQALRERITQIKSLGHTAQEEEQQLEKVIKQLNETKQRIENLWQYSIPYGQA